MERIDVLQQKLKQIEEYIDRHPDVPLEVIIKIKDIIYGGVSK